MTPEQINVAIAEACAKYPKLHLFQNAEREWRYSPTGYSKPFLPASNLNACAAMEATLSEPEERKYDALLSGPHSNVWRGVNNARKATAPQRCEAFLRTKGLLL